MDTDKIALKIGPNTRFILGTSGRLSSLERYRMLLQDILKVDIAYIPINSGDMSDPRISPERYASALKGMPCIGGSISRDIKHSIIPFLDEIDDLARDIQSVNTVVTRKDGNSIKLKGYNSDALGFRQAIQNGMASSGIEVKTAVCYGYGGVTSVVTSVLQGMGIKVFLAGRNMQTAAERAKELNVDVWSNEIVDLFVNATPATESPLEQAPNLLPALQGCKVAFDHEMPGKYLAQYCAESGVYHIKGTEMYYPQMVAQWRLFLEGLVAPEAVEALLREADGAR
jgi:shikimate dehydrogenase